MTLSIWVAFLVFVFLMVALDLGVFHRIPKAPSIRDALAWTMVWVAMALLFIGVVYMLYENNYTWASLKFFVRVDGVLMATPLFLALLLVESGDIMFAVDSIPAIFAVTRDPFIIFTSNIFAILGLRSLYFVLAGYMAKFRYLKNALVFVLAYVGVKMIISNHYHIPDGASMSIIIGILLVGVLASIKGAAADPVPLKSPLDVDK